MFSFQGTFVTLCKVTFEKLIFSFSKLTLVEMRRVLGLCFANPICSTTEYFVFSTRFATLTHKTIHRIVFLNRSCLAEFDSLSRYG